MKTATTNRRLITAEGTVTRQWRTIRRTRDIRSIDTPDDSLLGSRFV